MPSPESGRREIKRLEDLISKNEIWRIVENATNYFIDNEIVDLYGDGNSLKEVEAKCMKTLVKKLYGAYDKAVRSLTVEKLESITKSSFIGLTQRIEELKKKRIEELKKIYGYKYTDEQIERYVRNKLSDKFVESIYSKDEDFAKKVNQYVGNITLAKKLSERTIDYVRWRLSKYEHLEKKHSEDEEEAEKPDN